MSPGEVLQAATLSAARLMRMDDELGSLDPGKRADLVVVEGSALELHGLRERVRETWMDGVLVHLRNPNYSPRSSATGSIELDQK